MFAKLRRTFVAALLIGASSLVVGAAAPAQAAMRHGGGGFHGGGFHGGGFHGGGFHGFHGFGGFHGFRGFAGGFHGFRGFGHSGFGHSFAFRGFGSRFGSYGSGRFAAAYGLAGRGALADRGRFKHGQYDWRNFGDHRGFDHNRYIGWAGPVFWPYAYDDVFDAALSPWDFYDPGYADFWGYGYDDLFGGVLVPYGYTGYGAVPAVATTRQAGPSPETIVSSQELCVSAQPIAEAVPVVRLKDELKPDADQSSKLQALIDTEGDATKALEASCATRAKAPSTPVKRLDLVEARLKDISQAVDTISGPLDAFYASLTDEQKARFNELGPTPPPARPGAEIQPDLVAACGPQMAIPTVAVTNIEKAVSPNPEQRVDLVALSRAADKADQAILATCPAEAPLTPTGRLAAIRTRITAMLQAVEDVRPALQSFWTSLDADQQSRLSAIMQSAATNGAIASAH